LGRSWPGTTRPPRLVSIGCFPVRNDDLPRVQQSRGRSLNIANREPPDRSTFEVIQQQISRNYVPPTELQSTPAEVRPAP